LNTTKVFHGICVLVPDESHLLVGPSGDLGIEDILGIFARILSSKDVVASLIDW
jgi:hypothetical protein